MGGPLLGEYSMRSFGESPKDGVESHLSQILEENAHPKYYLSAKACQGILRRAENRGKKLPPILKTALIAQSASKSELESLGGVKESSYSTTESAHSQPSTIKPSLICLNDQGGSVMSVSKDKSGTLSTLQARDYKGVGRMDTVSRLTYSLQGSMIGRADKNGPQGDGINEDKCFTLNSTDRHAVANAIVRRLTPLECERLQGYPDGWTHIGDWIDSKGKKHRDADNPKYKALGNSIALPPWTYVLSRLNGYCVEHTMASLFDGIGGFPLIWERLNGKGSAVWASEVEEFPIAVTKTRFGQE